MEKNQLALALTILLNLQISKFHKSIHKKKRKYWNCQSLNTTPYVGKFTLVQYILLILPFTVFEEQCLAQRFCKLS